jgi:hypothetical protein
LHEQEPGPQFGKGLADPALLLLDDGDHLAVDEDAVGRDVDLALGVTEARHLFALDVLDGPARRRGEAVELTRADLAARRPVRIWSRIIRIACGSSNP